MGFSQLPITLTNYRPSYLPGKIPTDLLLSFMVFLALFVLAFPPGLHKSVSLDRHLDFFATSSRRVSQRDPLHCENLLLIGVVELNSVSKGCIASTRALERFQTLGVLLRSGFTGFRCATAGIGIACMFS